MGVYWQDGDGNNGGNCQYVIAAVFSQWRCTGQAEKVDENARELYGESGAC
jgi:hypothetical protein